MVKRTHSPKTRAFALVVTLGIIVIVTLLVVSFVSIMRLERQATGSYTAGFGATELAQGAADALTAAFLEEMRTRSEVRNVNGVEIFLPRTHLDTPPQVTIPTAARSIFPTVVRVSSPTNGLGDFPASLAAQGGSSALAASGGRRIAPQRWAAPKLFAATNAPSLPAPEWIFWTASGPTSEPVAPADVLGRFAFVAYDTGGLLNANVAGFPLGGDKPSAADLGRKGGLAFVDLSLLPGMSEPLADRLVRWRETEELPPDWTASARNYRRQGARGIRTGGNAFLDRQELIRYVREALGETVADQVPPFLTTRSMAYNAPSLVPDPARPRLGNSGAANDTGGTESRTATLGRDEEFNPAVPGLVWLEDTVVNAGTTDEYQVRAGAPFVTRRFDLNKLALLENPSGNAAEIRRIFGLESLGGNPVRWEYVNGLGGTTIRTLPQLRDAIASGSIAARDPDFFEMLQAAIPLGSLGRDGGMGTVQSATKGGFADEVIMTRDQNPFLQILGIGANIIDQVDSDSYPTEINTPGGAVVYGIENLPYLQRVIYYAGRMAAPNEDRLGGWLLFDVWNPHQNPSTTGTGVPSQLRISADGNVKFSVRYEKERPKTPPPPAPSTPAVVVGPFEDGPTSFTKDSDSLIFPIQTFGDPTLLTSSHVTAATTQYPGAADFHGKIQGLHVGSILIVPSDDGVRRIASQNVSPNSPTDIILQYSAPDGWRTYHVMQHLWEGGPWIHNSGAVPMADGVNTYGSDDLHRYFAIQRADPRTDRFGSLRRSTSANASGQDRASGFSMRPQLGANDYLLTYDGMKYSANSGFFKAHTGDWTYMGSLAENTTGGASPRVSYVHPDGVRRRADSAYLAGNIPDGQPMATGNTPSRPVILNRPFKNVGELGYVFRGEPWSTLSLWTTESADTGLLDYFCVDSGAVVTSDMVNLNSAPRPVLKALLQGTMMRDATLPGGGDYLTAGEVDAVADAILSSRPFANRADMATRLAGELDSALQGNANRRIKTRREGIIRALSEVADLRTWNLFFDIITQSGKVPSGRALTDFVTQGERRLWVHVALDRYTGAILALHTEEVNE